MRLTRITKIRGHRVFRDFVWPSELHACAQFNVIYGWNGCGKTTLSSLLALVEKRTALIEGELELEFDGVQKITGRDLSTKPVPQLRVFNRDFVSNTLQATGGISPIYFLGEANVEKQAQVDALKKELGSAEVALTMATAEKKAADSKLDDFCISRAKIIKELLTTANSQSYNNYDKRRFNQAVRQLTPEAATGALLSEGEKALLRRQKDAQPKATIEKVAVPSIDLASLEAEVTQLIGRSVVAQTLDELTEDAEVGTWVRRGITLHSGVRHSDTCRFCRQSFIPGRRSEIEAHFNDAFEMFQGALDTLSSKLETAKRTLSSMRLPETSRLYDHLVEGGTTAIDGIAARITTADNTLDVLLKRVGAKRERPFDAAPQSPIASQGVDLADAFHALDAIIDKHNKTTEEFRRSVKDACTGLERCYVAEARTEYAQLVEAAEAADAELEKAKTASKDLEREIDTLERQIVEHRRPADELTEELQAYLGHDELRFEVKGSGYALTRSGQPVSHLSEGERTAIAFIYFLKSLQDKGFDLAQGIVVIDDPVSSLDANALFSAFGYMKERTKQCGQLFIFTHSFPFFRLVKNWFHHLPGQRKANVDRRPARFFMLRAQRDPEGRRASVLGPLDRLLEEHESEYQYLFKRVHDEAHRSDIGSLERHYGLPNVARRLVEAFLAFRFPDLSGDLGPRLDRVNFDNARKTRVLRLLNTYSHAGAISDPEHDLSLLAETQPVLLDVLDMMKAADKEHYEGLEKLLARPEDAS